ncbi:hypothetical protein ACLKA6_009661 [Drosophila palustris]
MAAIVCIALPAMATTRKTTEMEMAMAMKMKRSAVGGYGYNMAAATTLYDNRWLPLEQHRPLHRYASKLEHESGVGVGAGERRGGYRSNSSDGRLEAMLNGLSNLSGLGHISNGYASVAPATHTEALAVASSKQETPIYEEHHEDAAVAAVAATANDYASDAGGEHVEQHQHSSAGFQPPTIYDYPAAPSAGGVDGAHGAVASYQSSFGGAQQEQAAHHYAYDKISVGNYLNHYDQSSDGFESYRQHHADEQQYQQQQQQQQQQQLQHASYYTPHEGATTSTGASGPHDYEDHDEQGSNFLAESNQGHDGAQSHSHSHSHSHHVDIINYVPVKHVKKEHVPVEKPVKIPISHAVIIPIKKPVPIHIPITKQVQVAVEKELKVPVERIVPVPVEKHIPVPVEKRVPYTVIKYIPIKVPKPFPVKVPVFKTVLHKVKSWW